MSLVNRSSIVLLVLIAASGCSRATDARKSPPPEELYSYDREYLDDDHREIVESFKNFEQFAQFVQDSDSLTIYEGLPHPYWERAFMEMERRRKEVVEIDGELFYAKPVEVDKEALDRIRKYMSQRSSFVPFLGFKGCGGFHSDWCLEFRKADSQRNAFICFGCCEMIVMDGSNRLIYCDIWNDDSLQSLLSPLHTQRPRKRE